VAGQARKYFRMTRLGIEHSLTDLVVFDRPRGCENHWWHCGRIPKKRVNKTGKSL